MLRLLPGWLLLHQSQLLSSLSIFDRIFVCPSGWPWTLHFPASASQVPGSQTCTTTSISIKAFPKRRLWSTKKGAGAPEGEGGPETAWELEAVFLECDAQRTEFCAGG